MQPTRLAIALLFLARAAAAQAPPTVPSVPPPVAPQGDAFRSRLEAVLGRPGGLTADEVGRRAAATNYDVKARIFDVRQAAARVDQALVAYFPRLSFLASYTRLSDVPRPTFGFDPTTGEAITFPVFLNQTIFQATLSLPLSDYVLRIAQLHAAAKRNKRSAEITVEATKLKAAADARTSYYGWVRAKLQVVVAEQALAQSEAHLRDSKDAFDVGKASRADVMRVESQLATSQLLLERARNLVDVLEDQLRTVMHEPELKRHEVADDLAGDAAADVAGLDLLALVDEAYRQRLELRAFDETAVSLRDQARAARSGYYPRVEAVGNLLIANPNQRVFPQQDEFNTTWDVGVRLTWAPTDLVTSMADVKTFELRASQSIAQRDAARDGVRNEVTQAIQALRDAEAALRTSARGLEAAEESYRVRRELFAFGRATSVELTDAETDLTRARLEAINARVDLRLGRLRLEHAVGRDHVDGGPAGGEKR